ncbi:fibronectin type III domain-containing protein [Flammeovirga aprica]|uniref:Fibronectin type-III domain-containing protein n=1 Tax=Flammeovirga aprica JL-4 TaxID=694437 RepID=A0A7X9RWB6_9BACT|nr:fibronectin type III domain-containing protein [Flammeovirga aprica]NME69900.1 hypothetical protein [Flammeovirga aprica JL-4]
MKNITLVLLFLNYFSFAQDYCKPNGNTSDEWIEKIDIGNWTSHSGNNGGYQSFTDTSSNLTLSYGEEVVFQFTPGYLADSYAEGWKVWIDFNENGNFYDEGEEIISVNPSKGPVSGSFILSQASSGMKRMRVMMAFNKLPTPCANLSYGEIEDYTIYINGPSFLKIDDLLSTATSCSFQIDKSEQQIPSDWVEIELRNDDGEVQYYTTNQSVFHVDNLNPRNQYSIQLRGYEETIASVPISFLTIDTNKIILLEDQQIDTVGNYHTIVDNGGMNGDYLSSSNLSHFFVSEDSSKALSLNIFHFDLENNYDFLRVHDVGTMQGDHLTEELTGVISDRQIFSDSAGLKLQMTSDRRVNKSGFILFPELQTKNQDTLQLVSKSEHELEFHLPIKYKGQTLHFLIEDDNENVLNETFQLQETIVIPHLSSNTNYKVRFRSEGSSFSPPQYYQTEKGWPAVTFKERGVDFLNLEWSKEGFEGETFYLLCITVDDTVAFSTTEGILSIKDLVAGQKYGFSISMDSLQWSRPYETSTLFDNVIKISADTLVVSHGFVYTDPGGLEGDYTEKTEIVQTLFPPNNDYLLSVEFIDIQLENNYDSLTVYADTIQNSEHLIKKYTSSYHNQQPLFSDHESGALTFSFDADRSVNAEGWKALINLHVKPPQLIVDKITETSVSLVWSTAYGNHFVLEAWSDNQLIREEDVDQNKYTFKGLEPNSDYSFRIKIKEGLFSNFTKVKTFRDTPELELHSVYDTLVYVKADLLKGEEIAVVMGDSVFTVNQSVFPIYHLKPESDYTIQAQFENSELSEALHFSTSPTSLIIDQQVYITSLADTMEEVLSNDVRLMVSNEYNTLFDLHADQFIYYEIVGGKGTYSIEDQSKNHKVHKYQLSRANDFNAYFDIPLEHLLLQEDTIKGVNVFLHNGDGQQTSQFYIPYAFSIRGYNSLYQGDTVLVLDIVNVSSVEKVYIDGNQIDFTIQNEQLKVNLPEFLGETTHDLRVESEYFYQEETFTIEGEQRLLPPTVHSFSFIENNELSLVWSDVFGASGYEYELYDVDSVLLADGQLSDTTSNIGPLKEGQFYHFNIRSQFNSIGALSEWTSITLYKPRETFFNPEIEFGAVTHNTISLSWNQVAEAEKYLVKWGENMELNNKAFTTSNELVIDGLNDSTLYSFEVITIYSYEELDSLGHQKSIYTLREIMPISCKIQSSVESVYTILVDELQLDTLEIERSDDSLFNAVTIDTVYLKNNQFTLSVSNSKYIRVRGIKDGEYSTYFSNTLFLKAFVPKVPELKGITCKIASHFEGVYTIAIDADSLLLDTLEIETSKDSTFYISEKDTIVLEQNHFDLTSYDAEYIRVRGVKDNRYVTIYSNILSLEKFAYVQPLPVIKTVTDSSASVVWEEVKGAKEYKIDCVDSLGNTQTYFTSASEYKLENLTADTWYTIKVSTMYFTFPSQESDQMYSFKTQELEKEMGECEVKITSSESNAYTLSLFSTQASQQFEILSSADSLFKDAITTIHPSNTYSMVLDSSVFIKVRGIDSLNTVETNWSKTLYFEYKKVITSISDTEKKLYLKFNHPHYSLEQIEFSYPVKGQYLLHNSKGCLIAYGTVEGLHLSNSHNPLPAGIYFLSVVDKGKIHDFKLIKK